MKLPPNDSMIWKALFFLGFNAAYVGLALLCFDNPPELSKDGPMLLGLDVSLLTYLGAVSRKAGDR